MTNVKASLYTLVAAFLLPLNAHAVTYTIQHNSDVVGETTHVTVEPGDTLTKIAQRYDIGITEMSEANKKLRFRKLKLGQTVTVPGQFILPPKKYRDGIVINMAELRLYYFPTDSNEVMTFPVAMGRRGWRTPTTMTRIVRKEPDPAWHVPKSIQLHMFQSKGILLPDVVEPGPKNPLGQYALYLAKSGYLIHGTNKPSSVGRFVSSGCIRMYPADIEYLFNIVPEGTKVAIIHHPHKIGWRSHQLFLEAHDTVGLDEDYTEHNYTSVDGVIHDATLDRDTKIDWKKVQEIANKRSGVPQIINKHEAHSADGPKLSVTQSAQTQSNPSRH